MVRVLLVFILLAGCSGQSSFATKSTRLGIHAHKIRATLAEVANTYTIELLIVNLAILDAQIVKMRNNYLHQFKELTRHTSELLPQVESEHRYLLALQSMALISKQKQEHYDEMVEDVTAELEEVRKRTAHREVHDILSTIIQTLPLPPDLRGM